MRDQPASAFDARQHADPLADSTIARCLAGGDGDGPDLAALAMVNAEIAQWKSNGGLAGWRASPGTAPHIAAALEDYVRQASVLPEWADAAQIARAEAVFIDMSMLSCTLLFCASLPACYLVPDLAAVLHLAGQLERHTDYRVRSTAAMIFPVMMRGGLTDPEGGGVAQALKVRLIHATIRHLVLRGAPLPGGAQPALDPLPPSAARDTGPQHQLYRQLHAHGWDSAARGLPINQEALGYTLLTFGYVFLDGLRRLGQGLPAQQEEAYLHAWNVLGHVLGIERAMMATNMAQAARLFEDIQAREGALLSAGPGAADPRPALAAALVAAMQRYLPVRLLKPFPVLLTRRLCGKPAARVLGLEGRVGLPARLAFATASALVRAIDGIGARIVPGFSLARLATRVLGYHLVARLLLDQARPLKLPDALLDRVHATMRAWRRDPRAPGWINALERRLTGPLDHSSSES